MNFDSLLNAAGGGKDLDIAGLAQALGGGGLQDIVGRFQQNGMGEIVQSWVSTGANLPVSAEQIQSVLGSQQVTQIASSLGIDASQIATALPGLIDQLTPGGQLPQGALGDILGQLGGSGAVKDLLGGLFKG